MIALLAALPLLAGGLDLPPLPEIKREAQVTYVDRSGAVLGVRGGRDGARPASRLTLREAAILAGVVKSPTAYNPADAPEKAGQRSQLVLDAMLETGAITPASRAKALAQVVKVQQSAPTAPAQYFVDWLDGQRRGLVGATRQDLVVETTLDLPMEERAAQTARATVTRYKAQSVEQAALVALDG